MVLVKTKAHHWVCEKVEKEKFKVDVLMDALEITVDQRTDSEGASVKDNNAIAARPV